MATATEQRQPRAARRTSQTSMQSQHSSMAKSAFKTNMSRASSQHSSVDGDVGGATARETALKNLPLTMSRSITGRTGQGEGQAHLTFPVKPVANSDTPFTSTHTSPRIRPTTLDIPGLTKSKVSPDGKVASRDLGSKLVIVMVGLPARGKSYVTKKLARYLNWLQHDTKIFNVGERRRIAAGGGVLSRTTSSTGLIPTTNEHVINGSINALVDLQNGVKVIGESDKSLFTIGPKDESSSDFMGASPPMINLNDQPTSETTSEFPPLEAPAIPVDVANDLEAMDQTADFFDPKNVKAAQLREQVAMSTLDELLDYILLGNGTVGILDATNSTIARRQAIVEQVRSRAGPELGVLFLESLCLDKSILEANKRLKLSGPDYKDQDPVASLADFERRIGNYERNYVPLGDYEEKNDMQYVQLIDVGRKVVSHQTRGFLASQVVYYLLNFNLSPRQIWITRHGESEDNAAGRIGGDSHLTEKGKAYARALTKFIGEQREMWVAREAERQQNLHQPIGRRSDGGKGIYTPPNPEYHGQGADGSPTGAGTEKSFCVWTSMLTRSIETAADFDEEQYDMKQMRLLNEINGGAFEGLTYAEIKEHHADQYEARRRDKLHYRYPGVSGEGYLDVINRLRPIIVEVERMVDHVLLIAHRSIARVLLAYFEGLKRDDVADLDMPLGMLYRLEPKPYGVDLYVYNFEEVTGGFEQLQGYQLKGRTRSIG